MKKKATNMKIACFIMSFVVGFIAMTLLLRSCS